MGSDDLQQQADDKIKAEAKKDRVMLSLEDVERLLRQNADARGKQVDKTPEQWRQWFDRLFEKLEREGPPEDHWLVLEEDTRLAREYERLAKEEEEDGKDVAFRLKWHSGKGR